MNINLKLSIILLLLIVLISIFAPVFSNYNPLEIQKGKQFLPPSMIHYFGTDEFGRDVFSRTLYAGRISLLAGLVAVIVSIYYGFVFDLIPIIICIILFALSLFVLMPLINKYRDQNKKKKFKYAHTSSVITNFLQMILIRIKKSVIHINNFKIMT